MSLKIISKGREISDLFGEEPIMAATIRLTKGCNLSCPHCYVNGGEPLKNELSTEEIKDIINQLTELKVFYIFFTGGEPFTRPDIVEILNYTHKKGIGISISTNGTAINERLLKKILHIPFNLFQVSLDGTKEIHDSIRGAGQFDKAIRAIKLARYYLKKNVGIGTVITRRNWMILDKIIEQGVKAGADSFTLLCLILTGRASDGQDPEIDDFLNSIKLAFEKYKNLNNKLKIAKDTTVPPALLPLEIQKTGIQYSFSPCSFPYYIGINSNGDIAPCDGLFNNSEMILGNIRTHKIADIWNNSDTFKGLRKINPNQLRGVCGRCIYKEYCSGACRAYAYIKYKDFKMSDPICQRAFDEGLFPKECIL